MSTARMDGSTIETTPRAAGGGVPATNAARWAVAPDGRSLATAQRVDLGLMPVISNLVYDFQH